MPNVDKLPSGALYVIIHELIERIAAAERVIGAAKKLYERSREMPNQETACSTMDIADLGLALATYDAMSGGHLSDVASPSPG